MHILYFHQYFNTPSVAGGTRSYEMARKLIERGHRVTMVCARSGKGELPLPGAPGDAVRKGVVDGIEVIQFNLHYSNYMSLPRRARVFLQYAFNSVKIALRTDCDLVFATSTPLTAGIPGICARWLRNRPFVFEVRDLWPELPRAMGVVKSPLVLAGMSLLEWMSYRSATACVALAPGIKEGIAKRSPKGRQIAMIPNGCDLEIFQPGRRQDLNLPGINPDDCVAVFTGAHGIANGLDAVLDAGRVLLERGRRDIVLAFIGDGKLKPQLIERARAEGLVNCRFFEPMPKNQLNQVVNCCDVGMMILDDVPAFYYGTSPNKFFDYISSGLPVINNYPGWLAGMIQQHKCGLDIPPRDPEAFADGLCRLADDPELRREYGENARRLAELEFSREKLANEFVDFLERQRP
ncbi:glycosyltransferase family 4 protein [Desulfofustis glycolicus]|uniref:Glycosyltransferase involved in cell wall bisynthesis n=1 Tax=Desulfofustis glycolicus DSM 9705 TaxID=1121409 RepID=A0A1M5VPG9_9BACT|nr:glycosyltransferase family 4 protein [Desulfofustis glycolicus]SHH77159.1 Glycosyltransferase involved in cell wall bisynthesis [Desulfofustis glycolicus DSM 9705]